MSSATKIFAVASLSLAFAGLGVCAPTWAEDDALAPKLHKQMAAAAGNFPPPLPFGTGGFAWGARPTFRPVGVASDHSSAKAPQSGQSLNLLADPARSSGNGKSGADFSLLSSEPSYADDDAAQPDTPGAALADDGERDGRTGPVNFPIGKSVKIKAQPLGGGLGGRVTFTFMLPTGQ